jgi:hypothetical protein
VRSIRALVLRLVRSCAAWLGSVGMFGVPSRSACQRVFGGAEYWPAAGRTLAGAVEVSAAHRDPVAQRRQRGKQPQRQERGGDQGERRVSAISGSTRVAVPLSLVGGRLRSCQ